MNKLNVLLLVAVVASAFVLVTLHYENRVLYTQLAKEQQTAYQLNGKGACGIDIGTGEIHQSPCD